MQEGDAPTKALAKLHFRFGFGCLFAFAAFGMLLELLHAFKIGAYLDVGQENRRLMWTLAHAHGVGLGLLQLGFGAALSAGALGISPRLVWPSLALRAGSLLMVGGFLLGGLGGSEGDPGAWVILVPPGGLLLLLGLGWGLRELGRVP